MPSVPDPANVKPWYLRNITEALALDEESGNVYVRTGFVGNIIISGNVNIPGNIQVYSTPEDPVHTHITEIGNSGILDVPYMPISGNVVVSSGNINVDNFPAFPTTIEVTQGTDPWNIAGNVNILTMPAITGNVIVSSGNINANVSGTVNIQDGGNSITVDFDRPVAVTDNNGSLTVDGTVTVNQGTTPWIVDSQTGGMEINFPDASITAFEELLAIAPYPIIQLDSSYGLLPDTLALTQSGGGTCTVETTDNLWKINAGTTQGAVAALRSRRYIRYRPGTGTMARFTAMYTTQGGPNHYGIAGATQQVGLINSGNGYIFGYSGLTGLDANGVNQAQFGILHRYGGKTEVRTLTITQAPTGSQTVTMVLNSITYSIPIVAGTTQFTAAAIAEFTGYGGLWNTDQIGSTVVFTAATTGPRTGTYSFSASGTGTLALGTFTQTTAGVANTNIWTYKSQWNGTQPVGFDPTKLNVFAIDMRWLGAGIVRFFMEDPASGKMILVHTQHWASTAVIPHIDIPSLRVAYAVSNFGTPSSAAIVRGASMYAAIQGGIAQTTYSESWFNVSAGNRNKDVVHHLISVKNPYRFAGRSNTRELTIQDLSVGIQGTDPAVIFVYINPTFLTDGLLFDTMPDSNTIVSVQDSPTIDATVNQPVVSFVLAINGTQQFDLLPYRLTLAPGDIVTVAFLSTNSITRTAVSLTWNTD